MTIDLPGDPAVVLRQEGQGQPAQPPPVTPKLLDRVRQAIRVRHYSPRTEQAYVHWIRCYIFFHRLRHPAEMGVPEINAFLSHLAVSKHVSASTQTQALSALVFLYRNVLDREVGQLEGLVRAKRSARLPVVLTRDEARRLFAIMDGVVLLACRLLYGSGLRLLECLPHARQRHRLRAQRDHGPQRQRTEGPRDDATRFLQAGAPRPSREGAAAAPG